MSWANKIKLPNGRTTFVAEDSAIPQAAKDSAFWEQCSDGRWYYSSGAFEGKTKICGEIAAPPSTPNPAEDAFLQIYGSQPGPNSLKWPWRQAKLTFVDDALPGGMTRAGVTRISDMVKVYGLPGAKFFRLRRNELPIDAPPSLDNVYNRVLFHHKGTNNGTIAYLDYPVVAVSDEKLDDTVRSWQEAVAMQDPASFPKWALIAPGHNDEVRAILEAAQAGA